jgi:hypothetical protein
LIGVAASCTLLLRNSSISGKGQTKTGDERIFAYTANANHVLCFEVFTGLGNNVVELDNLPERAQIKGMLQVLTPFGIQFAK